MISSIMPVLEVGNPSGFQQKMQNAAAGAPTVIGAIGGSITAGAKATVPENRYINRIVQHWQATFSQSDTKLVNAGIGATGSAIGAFRVCDDLLAHRPDIVVVEFAVNDGGAPAGSDRTETYEAVVRRCLAAGAAVLLLFLPREDGRDASADQRRVGAHYNLPMVSVVDAVTPYLDNKSIKWTDYAADSVHPNDDGHELIARHVCACLAAIRAAERCGAPAALPSPLTSDRYCDAQSLGSSRIAPVSYGAFVENSNVFVQFRDGWVAEKPGNPIVFELYARTVQLLILRSVARDAGYGTICVETAHGTVQFSVDARFPDGWGDYALPVCVLRADEVESVRISLRCDAGRLVLLRVQAAV